MAHAREARATSSQMRVQVIAPERLGATAIAALRARQVDARAVSEVADDPALLAWAFDAMPSLAQVVPLAETCQRAALAGHPVCLLVPPPRGAGSGRVEIERAAAMAYLQAHGAAVGHDVDAWLESIVLLARFGLPVGPHTAVIAPTGSWLESQAIAIATEAVGLGNRPPVIGESSDEPTDVALYDPVLAAPTARTRALLVPVVARPELAGDGPALYTARAAFGATQILGRAAERAAIGLGPAPREAAAELAVDRDALIRQLDNPNLRGVARIADHETKVLLRAYGVAITRQAVATTPSAAVRAARRAGYPVEIKPWGHTLPVEPGCFVEKDVKSDALVRSAFANAVAATGLRADDPAAAVIVRVAPQPGRELAITFVQLPSIGWTVVVDAPGVPVACAPCPLRVIDADMLARATVVASRAGDPEPDRVGLANLLRRASHLVVDHADRITQLGLPRVIVGGRGVPTLVVDAYAELS